MTEPGWYNDERDPSSARWHDGITWTQHTVPKGEWVGRGDPPPPTGDRPSRETAGSTGSAPSPSGPALGRPEARLPWESPDRVPSAGAAADAAAVAPSTRQAREAEPASTSPRAPRERPGWMGWWLALPAALVVLVAILLQGGVLDDDPSDPIADSGLPTYGAEFQTAAGGKYRLTVVPASEAIDGRSPAGCLDAPSEGHANLGFYVRIDNLSDHAVPMPDLLFAVNATSDGKLDSTPEGLSGVHRQIEVTPRADDASCEDAFMIRPAGRDEIDKGESATFRGVVGDIVSPAPAGLALLVRYGQGDAQYPEVSSLAEVLAPFPPAPAARG